MGACANECLKVSMALNGGLVQDCDATGEPVDIDFELALTRSERDASAVAAAVRIEPDRADLVVHQVLLRREELDLEFLRQCMLAAARAHDETPAFEIEREKRLLAGGHRLASSEPQSRCDL